MLERIHIRGFKSLHDVEVSFRPLLVFLGPNAAGKSNFLEALLLLSRIVTERTLREAFDAPLRGYPHEQFSLPDEGLGGLLAMDEAHLSIEADLSAKRRSGASTLDPLRYSIGININPESGNLSVYNEYLARLRQDGSAKGLPRIELEDPREAPSAEPHGQRSRLAVRRLGEAGHPVYEDIGLTHALVSNLQYSGETRYPDFDRLRSDLGSWRSYYLDPRTAMRAAQAPREVDDVGAFGEWIAPFLYRLKVHPEYNKQFDAIQRVLRSAIPSIESLDVELDKRRGTLDITIVQDGIPYSSRVISEGTLRVLALCALAASPWPGSLVAFEEPENGVHPRRLDIVAGLLLKLAKDGSRQVVVTTHSPELVNALLRLQREEATGKDLIGLIRCNQRGGESRFAQFDADLPIFRDQDVQKALKNDDDDRTLEAMLMRGWLDD